MTMNTLILSLLLAIGTLFPENELKPLNVGDAAPKTELKMTNVDGRSFSLSDVKGKNGLCVVFSCNTCPYVIGWEDRYNDLAKLCKDNGVGFILVNSNEAKRGDDDSMEAMLAHAKEIGYGDYPYVVDSNHALADAFGATKTPDVFLFNAKLQLAYKGAIDDNMKEPKAVKEPYLANAVKTMVAGKPCTPAETKAIGCSIKRVKS